MKSYNERTLEDYLRHIFSATDPKILKALKEVLSAREQGSVEPHISLVTQRKLVALCKHPDEIQEVILIGRDNLTRVRRERLTLKGKQDPSKA